MTVRILPSGDTALIVDYGDRIDATLNERVLTLAQMVTALALPGIIEVQPTFRSLMIHFDPLTVDPQALEDQLWSIADAADAQPVAARHWRVPVCYEGAFAPDLEDVAAAAGIEPSAVVRLHTETEYRVYMLGFLPGYPYMGDLPAALHLPRRRDPRVRVPAGSVAIAMAMTAVYPLESPGGWHLIGSCPWPLFDLAWSPPAVFAPGDRVRFEPVSAEAYRALQEQTSAEAWRPVPEERP